MPACAFLTIEESIKLHAFNRGLAFENARPMRSADELWAREWIPLFWFDNGCWAADCRGPDDGPSPMLELSWWASGDDDYGTPVAESLGELVIRATDWLRREQLRFEPDRRLWWPVDAYMAWPTVLGLPTTP